jgi:hypothetical protein
LKRFHVTFTCLFPLSSYVIFPVTQDPISKRTSCCIYIHYINTSTSYYHLTPSETWRTPTRSPVSFHPPVAGTSVEADNLLTVKVLLQTVFDVSTCSSPEVFVDHQTVHRRSIPVMCCRICSVTSRGHGQGDTEKAQRYQCLPFHARFALLKGNSSILACSSNSCDRSHTL